MSTLAEKLLEQGIRPRSYGPGNYKLLCPKCSHTRKNRSDPCLSLTIEEDRAIWNCKNGCGFVGSISEDRGRPPTHRQKAPPVRPQHRPDGLPLSTGSAGSSLFR